MAIKVTIKSINSVGDLERERIVLKALDDCDVGLYAIFATKRGASTKTVQAGKIPYCFWLPDKAVKKNDLIIVYTKKGKASVKQNPSGATSHFLYWGEDHPIWANERTAVLCEVGTNWLEYPEAPDDATEEIPADAPSPPK
jgi:hypothetical protein